VFDTREGRGRGSREIVGHDRYGVGGERPKRSLRGADDHKENGFKGAKDRETCRGARSGKFALLGVTLHFSNNFEVSKVHNP
jgi:hypothetical protein